MAGRVLGVTPSRVDATAEVAPRAPTAKRGWLIPGGDELFRSLYTGLPFGAPASIAVCSAVSGEGKTTLSLGLALTIAQDLPDRRVVVVETDLWRPVLARDFALEPGPGLVDVLLDRVPTHEALRPTSLDNLSLVVAGAGVLSAQRLLRSARMPQVLDELGQMHDVVILDTPATLAHSEVSLLARMVNDVIFIVRTGVTPARDLATALARLQGSKIRGIIVNDARSSVPKWVRHLVRL